jgi:hypothetical protein
VTYQIVFSVVGGLGFGVLGWFGLALVITNARTTTWLWAHTRGGAGERLARWFLGPRPRLGPPPEGTRGATPD